MKADSDLLWKTPDNTSFEEAVTMNVGTLTAVQALFQPDRLGLVEPPQKVAEEIWVCMFLWTISRHKLIL